MNKKRNSFFILIISLVAILMFQNCSEVNLQRPGSEDNSQRVNGIRGQFCLNHPNSGDLNSYSYTRFYVLPVTSLPRGNSLVADSDIDGIADIDESLSERINRRTRGIIDRLCTLPDCTPTVGSCNSSIEFFNGAINQCDVSAISGNGVRGLNLDGLDSNGNPTIDYIPDIIEVLRGSSVATVDTVSENSDNDSVTNENEIINNSDLLNPNSNSGVNKIQITEEQDIVSHADCNGGNSISFSISNVITVPTLAFFDGSGVSHSLNENLILLIVVSNSLAGDIQYQSHLLKVTHGDPSVSIDILPSQFEFEGLY